MDIVQAGLAGLQRAEKKLETTAQRLSTLPLSVSDTPEDVVDISAEAVALMQATHAYQASLKIIESGDELQQSLLDVIG